MSNENNAPVSTAPVPFVDLALVANLARQKAEAEAQPILLQTLLQDNADARVVLNENKLIFIHKGQKLDLSEALVPVEAFKQEHTTVNSFCEALKRWGRLEMTVVAIHPTEDRMVAVLDYYSDRRRRNARKEWQKRNSRDIKVTKDEAGIARTLAETATSMNRKLEDMPGVDCLTFIQNTEVHRMPPVEFISLKLQPSEEYTAWVGINGKEIEQAAFVEFLELRIQDVQGDGQQFAGANQLLKVAMELEARKDVQWASRVNPQTGDRSMVWKEQTGAEGGAVVPKRVQVLLRPWVGANAMHYVAALSFRASPQGVKFKLTFIGLDRCREAARAMVADQVAEATDYPVFDAAL